MADQAKTGWVNPVKQEHVVGAAVGIVATAFFSFAYPGWFMSRSAAGEQREAEVAKVHAKYCLASYLSSGVTAEQAADVRRKPTGEQSAIFVKTGHALDEDIGRACGKMLDQLSTDKQIEEGIKEATAAAAARNAKMTAAKDGGTKPN
jgi:hypothetical protein